MKITTFFGIVAISLLLLATDVIAAAPWKSFTKENTPALPGNEIQYLGIAPGGVWIGTLNGAVTVQNGKFKPFKDAQGEVVDKGIWTVLETPTGPWIGTDSGAFDCRGGKVKETLKTFTVVTIVEGTPGTFWALGKIRNGAVTLFEYKNKEWEVVEAAGKLRIMNLYRTANGLLWLTLEGNGVLEIDPAVGFDKAVHHLKSLNVTSLMQDSRGDIWCGLWGNGVARWDGKDWVHELSKLKASAILSIVEDNNANIWVATSANGVWTRPLIGLDWKSYLSDEGGINLLVATRDGRIWISGQSLPGLHYWNGTEWIVSIDSPLPIRALVEADDGTLWAGGVLDGVYMLKK